MLRPQTRQYTFQDVEQQKEERKMNNDDFDQQNQNIYFYVPILNQKNEILEEQNYVPIRRIKLRNIDQNK